MVFQGILVCTEERCLSEYPIIDGIPLIVADLRRYISENIDAVMNRSDLSEPMESILGDCCGPGNLFDSRRQHLSTYGFDHYGDLDPEEVPGVGVSPGSVLNLLETGLSGAMGGMCGPVIDVGCSVGRTTFELAERCGGIVLGVDMNFSMLRAAAGILYTGNFSYPRRRVGIVYDRRSFPVRFERSENVDFWACDAMALPFSDTAFSLGVSLNVLDCVGSPHGHLKELERILMPGANVVFSSPYDWNAGATPVAAWLGGHSQRSDERGESDAMLRSLLCGGSHPERVEALETVEEYGDIPWTLRLYDRSFMEYRVHMVLARKKLIEV